ncbi:MAG: OB-fold nucleic acid binding domain-containing protein, partial [Ktedonobacterales bacterium]
MASRTPRKGITDGATGGAASTQASDSTSPHSHLATALRTASCGELAAANVGQRVVLTGWVGHRRDYGKLIFIDLRDRYGLTQVVFDPERSPESAKAHAVASEARLEYVLRVEGVVVRRLPGKENPNLPTGEIEVEAHTATVLNPAKVTPFPIADYVSAEEPLRLRYRYLDLRRGSMREKVELRHRAVKQIPFPRISYAEAMERYGNDRPDLRFELPLVELGDLARVGSFKVFH